MALETLNQVKSSIEFYFVLVSEVTTKNYIQLSINSKIKEISGYLLDFEGKEIICKDILSRETNFSTNYEVLFIGLNQAIKKYEIMI